jgi:hypothetical protein
LNTIGASSEGNVKTIVDQKPCGTSGGEFNCSYDEVKENSGSQRLFPQLNK